jgi:murein DD-endopeptidase MepM/ murein hydrolase activator NlpD
MLALLFIVLVGFICGQAQLASAQQWQAVQGDVLVIELPATGQQHEVRAFGKTWPWKQIDGQHIKSWIGIDLKAKPGNHTILIRGETIEQRHQLKVIKGDFRISRIEVAKKMAEFDAASLKRLRADQAAIKATYAMQVKGNPDISIAAQPTEGIVSTPFGAQRYVNGAPRSPHSGLDIAAPEGTPIITPLAGRVLLAESMFLNGNTVVIGHGNGLVMVYSHMNTLEVKQGDRVKSGERIGAVGMTGRATGPHLHWGVRFNQARINPSSLLTPSGNVGNK